VLLGVLVRLEELSRPVDEQRVQARLQRAGAKRGGDFAQQGLALPGRPSQLDGVGRDLARVPHRGVEQRALAMAELRGAAGLVQPGCGVGAQRRAESAEVRDTHLQVLQGQAALCREACRGRLRSLLSGRAMLGGGS